MHAAFAQQVRGEKWKVYDKENNQIWEFPNPCNEHLAMSAIRMARKMEREAFMAGVSQGHKERQIMISDLQAKLDAVTERNNFLAEQIKRHLDKYEEESGQG
jgi:hypothetical protein